MIILFAFNLHESCSGYFLGLCSTLYRNMNRTLGFTTTVLIVLAILITSGEVYADRGTYEKHHGLKRMTRAAPLHGPSPAAAPAAQHPMMEEGAAVGGAHHRAAVGGKQPVYGRHPYMMRGSMYPHYGGYGGMMGMGGHHPYSGYGGYGMYGRR